jgi:hypothetical protein
MASPHQESLVVDSGVSPVETDDPTSKASASDSATMLEKEKLEVFSLV